MKRRLSGGVTSRQNASSYCPLQLDACLECMGQFVFWENTSIFFHNFLQTNVLVFLIHTYIHIQLYLRNRRFKDLYPLMLSLIEERYTYVRVYVCVCARVCACLAQTRNCIYSTVFRGS